MGGRGRWKVGRGGGGECGGGGENVGGGGRMWGATPRNFVNHRLGKHLFCKIS